MNDEKDLNYNCVCRYKQTNYNCIMFNKKNNKCEALQNCEFYDKNLHKRQCPFYKANMDYKFVVWDRVLNEIVTFEKTIDDARSSVKTASQNYYASGLDDERYVIKKWKGRLDKLYED